MWGEHRGLLDERRSRSVRDDNKKSQGNGKRRSRFPGGMTERKTTARAKAKEEADPCGMTERKATARAKAKEEADSQGE